MIKTLNKVVIGRMYLNIIKAIYDIFTSDITFNSKKVKAFPLRSGARQRYPLSGI